MNHTKIKRIPASRDLLKKRHKHLFKALHGYMSRYRKKHKHHRMLQ